MRKKNYCALALAAALSLSLLAGCAGNKGASSTTAAVESGSSADGAGSLAGEPETSAGGAGSSAGGPGSSADGAGSSQIQADDALADLLAQIKEAYGENYRPQTEMDAQLLADQTGVKPELYDSYVAEMPLISTFVETFIGIKAKDGKGDEVADALDAYRERLAGDTMQYPMNMPAIQASQVVRHGDYVFFVMLGAADDAELEKGEEEALKSAEKNNRIALDLIDDYFNE